MATKAAAKVDRHQGKEYRWAAGQVTLGHLTTKLDTLDILGGEEGLFQTQPLPELRAEQGK